MKFSELLTIQFKLAWRNIWRQKKRSLIVMSAAGVGMLGITLTVGFMNGMSGMMVDNAIESGLGHVQIRPKQYVKNRKLGLVFDKSKQISAELALNAKKHNFNFAARYEREGLIKLDEKVRGVKIIGIDPEDEKKVSLFDEWITSGSFLKSTLSKNVNVPIVPILLGQVNSKYFEVELNDYIILSLTGKSGESISVRGVIKGFFKSIAEPIDKYTVLISRKDLSRLYAGSGDAPPLLTEYFVVLGTSLEQADLLKSSLQKPIHKLFGEVMTYRDLEPGIHKILDMSDTSMLIFYTILMTGFAFVLMNTVLMSIYERMREFGILRAIGTPRKMIFMMIISESLLLTIIGCIIGILFGGTINLILHKVGFSLAMFAEGMEKMGGSGSTMYPYLTVEDILSALILAIIINLLATIYPAIKAIRLVPVKSIHTLHSLQP